MQGTVPCKFMKTEHKPDSAQFCLCYQPYFFSAFLHFYSQRSGLRIVIRIPYCQCHLPGQNRFPGIVRICLQIQNRVRLCHLAVRQYSAVQDSIFVFLVRAFLQL